MMLANAVDPRQRLTAVGVFSYFRVYFGAKLMVRRLIFFN